MVFTCGHTGMTEPRNMGRGAARIHRLERFYARPCLNCAKARELEFRSSLSNTRDEAFEQKTAQVIARLELSYR